MSPIPEEEQVPVAAEAGRLTWAEMEASGAEVASQAGEGGACGRPWVNRTPEFSQSALKADGCVLSNPPSGKGSNLPRRQGH